MSRVFVKLFMDQTCIAPVVIASILSINTYLSTFNAHEVALKLQMAWFPALLSCWKVWPLAQFVNFKVTNKIASPWVCR